MLIPWRVMGIDRVECKASHSDWPWPRLLLQARRSFLAYLNAERPGRRSPMAPGHQVKKIRGCFRGFVGDEKLASFGGMTNKKL